MDAFASIRHNPQTMVWVNRWVSAMARKLERLTALAVSRAKTRGYLADGGGLYLQISSSGAKSWVFRFKRAGWLREMGLGATHTLTLAEARKRAAACRLLRLDGVDPIDERRAGTLKAKPQPARTNKTGWGARSRRA
jgi:Arm DNA-binding domain